MTFEAFLQFLNLPILAGVAYGIRQMGYISRMLEDHERRINDLERRQRSHRAGSDS
jgi:hypothetical protein